MDLRARLAPAAQQAKRHRATRPVSTPSPVPTAGSVPTIHRVSTTRSVFTIRLGGFRRILGVCVFAWPFFVWSFFASSFLGLAGCGAPGEPTAPAPPVPSPITDLSAKQAGDGAQLTFTLPAKTVSGERMPAPPAIEILRGAMKPDGSVDAKSFHVVYTIPGSLLNRYQTGDHIEFALPITPEETREHPGESAAFRVRGRLAQKRASADSNTVTVRLFPVPERIPSIETKVTETAVELTWPVPAKTSGGEPLASVAEYHVYRGELDPSSADAAKQDLSQAKWKSPLSMIGRTTVNRYRDESFEFSKTYLYVVRSVVTVEGNAIESNDSAPAIVTPRDIFPPATPQSVLAAVIAGANGTPPEVDLSWSINSETDLAGYRVYRSEQQGTRGQPVTSDLLPTPAYRDTSVQPGHRYWYTVTAVDRAGNESTPSPPAEADVTQPSP